MYDIEVDVQTAWKEYSLEMVVENCVHTVLGKLYDVCADSPMKEYSVVRTVFCNKPSWSELIPRGSCMRAP